jgi:hypothetical protein
MALHSILEWLSLILLMCIGVYTMSVIKNEKKNYIKNAVPVEFRNFKLFIPSWWEVIPSTSENEITFKRANVRLDWHAKIIWTPIPDHRDLVEIFKEQIATRKILFDEENSIIYNPGDFQEGALVQSGLYEILRLEGTATEDDHERLYYDSYLIREKSSGQYLYAESRSAILTGLVEGPYFETVMTRIEFVNS